LILCCLALSELCSKDVKCCDFKMQKTVGGASTCFLHDVCDLLESFSQSVCSGQDRGDTTSTNERSKKGFSLVLGSMVDSQKTHG